MARDFSKNAANYMSLGAAAIGPLLAGATGMTICAWVLPRTLGSGDSDDFILFYHNSRAASGLRLRHSVVGAAVTMFARRTESQATASNRCGSSAVGTGSWIHACGTVTFGSIPDVYLNGTLGNSATNATIGDVTAGSFTHTTGTNLDSLGCAANTAAISGRQIDGLLAEVAVWGAVLNADEIAGLSKGRSPLKVRPDSLAEYWPLVGRNSSERGIVAGTTGTITGTVGQADHPRIYR